MYPFEQFTDEAKQVLTLAQGEAERSHQSYIGTEHILLGMFQAQGAMAALILEELGVGITSVRDAIKDTLGRNERVRIQQIVPTSRVKKVIEISFDQARERGEGYVGTQHLLLGLMIEGDGIAAHVLQDLGVSMPRVLEAIARLSAAGIQEGPAPGAPQTARQTAGPMGSSDPRRLADGLDDLAAVELLAALLDRFGAAGAPPHRLLDLAGELRQVRHRKDAAVAAQDYEAAKRFRDEELRLQEHATAQLGAWRRQQG